MLVEMGGGGGACRGQPHTPGRENLWRSTSAHGDTSWNATNVFPFKRAKSPHRKRQDVGGKDVAIACERRVQTAVPPEDESKPR